MTMRPKDTQYIVFFLGYQAMWFWDDKSLPKSQWVGHCEGVSDKGHRPFVPLEVDKVGYPVPHSRRTAEDRAEWHLSISDCGDIRPFHQQSSR